MEKLFSRSYAILLLILLLTMTGIISLQTREINLREKDLSQEELKRLEDTSRVQLELINKIPKLGFNNLVADWLYLQFIQYFGDTLARNQTGYSLNPLYFQEIVNNDPRFAGAYFTLEPATTLFSGMPQVSVALMNQGLAKMSPQEDLAYQVWFYKGIAELLFVGSPQEAKKSFQKAAQWSEYHNTSSSLNTGNRAREIADFLATNPDSTKARASAWLSIYVYTPEKVVREFAQEQIEALGAKIIPTPTGFSVKFEGK